MPGQEAACIQPTNQTIAPGIAYLRQARSISTSGGGLYLIVAVC